MITAADNLSMRVSVLLFLAGSVFAQGPQPAPSFTSSRIRPANGRFSKILAPGMIVELWGENLAPPSCRADRVAIEKIPPAACGVRVLIGSREAELLYVSSGQINLKIPADVPAEGTELFQVCAESLCSAPVAMHFSVHTALLDLAEPAYVHMPVWIHADVPSQYTVAYPCGEWLWDFGGYDFEVTRNGQALPKLAAPARPASEVNRPASGIGPWIGPVPPGGCAAISLNGEFPLHLLYNFDEPGTYSVRLTAREKGAVVYQSDWTDIEIQPFSEEKHRAMTKSPAGTQAPQ